MRYVGSSCAFSHISCTKASHNSIFSSRGPTCVYVTEAQVNQDGKLSIHSCLVCSASVGRCLRVCGPLSISVNQFRRVVARSRRSPPAVYRWRDGGRRPPLGPGRRRPAALTVHRLRRTVTPSPRPPVGATFIRNFLARFNYARCIADDDDYVIHATNYNGRGFIHNSR